MKKTTQTFHVKFLMHRGDEDAGVIADEMREAGVVFSVLPTSGVSEIIVSGIASGCGLACLRFTADYLIGFARSGDWPRSTR